MFPLDIILQEPRGTSYSKWLSDYTFSKAAGDREKHDKLSQLQSNFIRRFIVALVPVAARAETAIAQDARMVRLDAQIAAARNEIHIAQGYGRPPGEIGEPGDVPFAGEQQDGTQQDSAGLLVRIGRLCEKITGYQVHYEEIKKGTSSDVICTVFETINTTGKRLTVFAYWLPDATLMK